MDELLGSGFFRFVLLPLAGLGLAVFLKHSSRNDRFRRGWRNEEFAVGLDLALTATLILAAVVAERGLALSQADPATGTVEAIAAREAVREDLTRAIVVLALFIFGLWMVSSIVRWTGWRTSRELHVIRGILLPLVVGVSFLLVAVAEVVR